MKKLFTLLALVCCVATGAWAETQNFTIDLSKFDNGLTYDSEAKAASITIGSSKAWSKLDLKEYLDQIDGNITNIKITLTENVGSDGRIALGLYDCNKTSWATNAWQDTGNSVTVWGLVGSSNATRIYNGTIYTTGLTLGSESEIVVDMNFTTKKFTFKQGGTSKVDSKDFVDTNIDLIRWFALYSWSANTTVIKSMSMDVTYTATKHTVTFSETASQPYTLVVKDVAGNTISAESNGTYSLYEGKKYYYTATPTDLLSYKEVSGNFTVGTADTNIPFTLTAVTLPSYTLPANALFSKATVPSGTKQTTGITRESWNSTGVGGPMNNSATWTYGAGYTWHATFDVYRATSDASVELAMYTTKGGASTSFLFDSEGVKYWTSQTTSYISNTALTPGKWYRVEIVSDLVAKLTESGNSMTVTITDLETETQFATKSGIAFRNSQAQWFLPTVDKVTNTILTNWYAYYIADDVVCSVSDAGYSTYYNSALAYTMPENVEGYAWNNGLVKAYEAGQVVPANTALVLKAAKGDYTLSFTNGGTAPAANALLGTDEATELTADENSYFYGLSLDSEGKNVGFYWMKENGAAFTNQAHKAYLKLAKTTTAPIMGFPFNDDDATAITNAKVSESNNTSVYNLAGQRVTSTGYKGILIKNGKKVINK